MFTCLVQNNWTTGRRVTFVVAGMPLAMFARGMKRAEFAADVAGGEFGRLQLTIPIPPKATGRYRFRPLVRATGSGAERCRAIRRRSISGVEMSHSQVAGTVAVAALGVGLVPERRDYWFEVEFERPQRTRIAGDARGNYVVEWSPDPPLSTLLTEPGPR